MKQGCAEQMEGSGADHVRALARGLCVLDLLRDRGPLTLTEIGAQLQVHKSTLHRLLNTLCSLGFVERDPDNQKYRLGLQLLTYGRRVVNDLQLRRVAMPHLEQLQRNSGESVLLSTLFEGKVLWLEILRPPTRGYQLQWGGQTSYAHSTSSGKAMLAFGPAVEAEHICRTMGLPKQTEDTTTSWDELREDLDRTRQRGYAIDRCENTPRLCCIAAPVFGPEDKVLGAISLSIPINRFIPETYLPLVPLLKYACQDVSRGMGASGAAILQLMVEEQSRK